MGKESSMEISLPLEHKSIFDYMRIKARLYGWLKSFKEMLPGSWNPCTTFVFIAQSHCKGLAQI